MSLFPTEIADAIRFFVDCEPVPQPRQRHTVRNGIVFNYTPKDHPVNVFKQVIKARAKAAYQGKPMAGPVRAYFLFLLPRPGRLIWKTRAMTRAWSPGRPDTDNYCKAVMDALNGLVFEDDSQIVDLHAVKMYCDDDESPGVEIMLEDLS